MTDRITGSLPPAIQFSPPSEESSENHNGSSSGGNGFTPIPSSSNRGNGSTDSLNASSSEEDDEGGDDEGGDNKVRVLYSILSPRVEKKVESKVSESTELVSSSTSTSKAAYSPVFAHMTSAADDSSSFMSTSHSSLSPPVDPSPSWIEKITQLGTPPVVHQQQKRISSLESSAPDHNASPIEVRNRSSFYFKKDQVVALLNASLNEKSKPISFFDRVKIAASGFLVYPFPTHSSPKYTIIPLHFRTFGRFMRVSTVSEPIVGMPEGMIPCVKTLDLYLHYKILGKDPEQIEKIWQFGFECYALYNESKDKSKVGDRKFMIPVPEIFNQDAIRDGFIITQYIKYPVYSFFDETTNKWIRSPCFSSLTLPVSQMPVDMRIILRQIRDLLIEIFNFAKKTERTVGSDIFKYWIDCAPRNIRYDITDLETHQIKVYLIDTLGILSRKDMGKLQGDDWFFNRLDLWGPNPHVIKYLLDNSTFDHIRPRAIDWINANSKWKKTYPNYKIE